MTEEEKAIAYEPKDRDGIYCYYCALYGYSKYQRKDFVEIFVKDLPHHLGETCLMCMCVLTVHGWMEW